MGRGSIATNFEKEAGGWGEGLLARTRSPGYCPSAVLIGVVSTYQGIENRKKSPT